MTDCIIIGGGLIGMLCARELKKSGLDILLFDKGELGQESSWAGGGILSPLHPWRYGDEVNQLAQVGHRAYPQLAEELKQESGIDPEYIRCGLLVLNSPEEKAATEWAKKWSMKLSVIDQTEELRGITPGLSEQFSNGLCLPEVAQMRNPRLVKAVKGSLDSLAINYKENTRVESLKVVDGQVKGIVANGQSYAAQRVLIAGGAWSAELLRQYKNVPDIKPVKGQMVLFKGEPGLLKCMLLADNRYLIPRKDGRILCGSTIENTGFDKSTSGQVRENLRQSAIDLFPPVKNLKIEHHWAGLRPGTTDGVPYIGEHGDIKGLYINAGHYRNGVILGIASAREVVAELLKSLDSVSAS